MGILNSEAFFFFKKRNDYKTSFHEVSGEASTLVLQINIKDFDTGN